MALDTRIPLMGQQIDTATPLAALSRGLAEKQQNDALIARQAEQTGYDRTQDAEKMKLLKQQSDLQAETFALAKHKAEFEQSTEEKKKQVRDVAANSMRLHAMTNPEEITKFLSNPKNIISETDLEKRDLWMKNPTLENLDFKNYNATDIAVAQAIGAIETPKEHLNAGGATGEMVDRLRKENPGMSIADALYQVQTGNRKDQTIVGGQVVPMAGAADAQGALAEGKAAGQERGTELGKAQANLEDQLSSFPQVQSVVAQLHELGKEATFTKAGMAYDATARQTLGHATKGAIAREAYINTVADVLLPLLRPTFGAQFTLQEGENLKKTLGNIDATPEEKDAALNAFLAKGFASIQSKQRRVGVDVAPDSAAPPPVGTQGSGVKFLGFE